MAKLTPSSIAQWLAAGAGKIATKAFQEAKSFPELWAKLRARIPGLSGRAVFDLASWARNTYLAGARLMGVVTDKPINVAGIPVDPMLFGGENLGRRFRARAVIGYHIQGEPQLLYRTIDMESSTRPTLESVNEYMAEKAEALLGLYPGRFGTTISQQTVISGIVSVDLRRAF